MRLLALCLLALTISCTKTEPKPVCDPETQPAPHWGERGGTCVPSCGALGGTAGFEDPCSNHDMIDVGIAYDQTYCCKAKEPVCNCDGYDPAKQECGKAGIDSCGKNVCLPVGTKGCVKDETPPDTKVGVPPPGVLNEIRAIVDANPGMINDCQGHPLANNFLIKVVTELQKKNKRWGYFLKPAGRVPRDILAYAYGPDRDNTHNAYVIDFVCAGCGNTPSDPDFAKPAPDASACWQLLNLDTGFADNGVYRSSL